jgi:hypothetical protein
MGKLVRAAGCAAGPARRVRGDAPRAAGADAGPHAAPRLQMRAPPARPRPPRPPLPPWPARRPHLWRPAARLAWCRRRGPPPRGCQSSPGKFCATGTRAGSASGPSSCPRTRPCGRQRRAERACPPLTRACAARPPRPLACGVRCVDHWSRTAPGRSGGPSDAPMVPSTPQVRWRRPQMPPAATAHPSPGPTRPTGARGGGASHLKARFTPLPSSDVSSSGSMLHGQRARSTW